MNKKKLTKKIWYGSDIDNTGQPIIPPLAKNPDDLDGLHEGELFLHNSDEQPNIWIRTSGGRIAPLFKGGGGTADSISWINITDKPAWLVDGIIDYSEIVGAPDLSLYAKKTYVDTTFVTLSGDEDVSGIKNFTNGLKVSGVELKYDSANNAVYFEKSDGTPINFYVTGGLSMYGQGNTSVKSIMDAIAANIDSNTLAIQNGLLTVIGGTGSGGIAEITKQMVIDALGFTPYSAENPNGYITAASIPSALKNPYALTFGSNTYDGSAAKSITASDLGAALSSDLAKYLPLSGGTLTANNSDTALILKGNANGSWVSFRGNDDTFYGSIGVQNDKTPYFYDRTAAHKLWHAGNDGSGSGLDADLLDGKHLLSNIRGQYDCIPFIASDGVMEVGKYIDFHADTTERDYSIRLVATGNYSNKVDLPSKSGTLALTIDNVASATKLQTARTIWGQSFDGSGNVGGLLTSGGVTMGLAVNWTDTWNDGETDRPWFGIHKKHTEGTSIYATTIADYNGITIKTASGNISMNANGDVGIDTPSPSAKLHVKSSSPNVINCESTSEESSIYFVGGGNSSAYKWAIGKGVWGLAGRFGIGEYNTKKALYVQIGIDGNVGIGVPYNANPSDKLHVNGNILATGNIRINQSGTTYDRLRLVANANGTFLQSSSLDGSATAGGKFYIAGTGQATLSLLQVDATTSQFNGNILATGGITMYSQRSLKNVVDERGLSLTELSVIKPTRYTWKDKRDDRIHFGGIADDIEKILPEVIYTTSDGTLTMDYGNAGFAIASSLIKPVVDHEERIKVLERENKELKEKLNRYEA